MLENWKIPDGINSNKIQKFCSFFQVDIKNGLNKLKIKQIPIKK